MNKAYNKSQIKSATKNENTQEKEIVDNEQIDAATTIERSPHDRRNPYAQINRSLIEDNSISMECRFLIIFLLSKPDNWKVNVCHLRNSFQGWAGRDKIYKLLGEAEKAGYMKKVTEIKRGCIRSNRWFISENASFSNNVHDTDYQELTTRKNSNKEIEIRNNTKKQNTPPSSAIIFYKEIGTTGITKEEYNQLSDEIGEIALNQTIDSMRKWITDDPNKRRRFSRKDILKKIIKWNKDFQRSLADRKMSKEIEEKNKAEENKRKCEENRENNNRILEKYRGNKLFEDKVKIIGFDVLIDCNGLKIHNLNNSGLEKFLEKFLFKEKDSS